MRLAFVLFRCVLFEVNIPIPFKITQWHWDNSTIATVIVVKIMGKQLEDIYQGMAI